MLFRQMVYAVRDVVSSRVVALASFHPTRHQPYLLDFEAATVLADS